MSVHFATDIEGIFCKIGAKCRIIAKWISPRYARLLFQNWDIYVLKCIIIKLIGEFSLLANLTL